MFHICHVGLQSPGFPLQKSPQVLKKTVNSINASKVHMTSSRWFYLPWIFDSFPKRWVGHPKKPFVKVTWNHHPKSRSRKTSIRGWYRLHILRIQIGCRSLSPGPPDLVACFYPKSTTLQLLHVSDLDHEILNMRFLFVGFFPLRRVVWICFGVVEHRNHVLNLVKMTGWSRCSHQPFLRICFFVYDVYGTWF